MGKAIIFDGNSILNRAFYGIRALNAPDGSPTNAVYGFVSIISKSLTQIGENPDYAAVAFDLPQKTFRHLKCESYKATRKGMPEELALQLPVAKRVAAALGLRVIESPGFEADDVLGTFSDALCKTGVKTYIVTGDRDSFQLVNDCVTVLLAATNETRVTTPEAIFENYGVSPKQLIDVKAIMGDSSDNIKGVPGVGEKGALALIQKYNTLDGVYDNLGEIKGSLCEKLKNGRESAYESRFLAEIRLDAPLGCEISDCAYKGADIAELRRIYTQLGFNKYLEALGKPEEEAGEAEAEAVVPLGDTVPGNEGDELFLLLDGERILVRFGDTTYGISAESASSLLSANRKFVCWSAKELLHLANRLGVPLPDCEDISLLEYLRSPADNGVTFERAAYELLHLRSGEASASLLPLMYAELNKRLDADMKKLYEEIEKPLCYVLCGMEERGFTLDLCALDEFSDRLSAEIENETSAIYSLAGEQFNINSTKQLGTILFDKLQLPHYRKTKSGYSTDISVLEKLNPYHPIIGLILDYRRDAKLKSTYCDGLSKQVEADGRIHTTFKQSQTLTGRLSSAEPNLQNIPVRSEKGRAFRRFFTAGEGNMLIDADYSQIELRILAHISGDEALINAFLSGEDIHAATASRVFGVPLGSVTHEMRKRAKAVNFGIIYGIGDFSLSQDLHIPRRVAAEYIESYLAKYPLVRDYLERVKKEAYENGFVTTMFGRRRYIPELAGKNKNLKAFGERVAMNTPIQGSAADLIKIAMVRTERELAEAGLAAKLILQIHDELIIEAPEAELSRATEILREAMTGAAKLLVPLVADIGTGKSWYDAKNG